MIADFSSSDLAIGRKRQEAEGFLARKFLMMERPGGVLGNGLVEAE